jgi:hypothetical protein
MLLLLAPFLRYGDPARALFGCSIASYALFICATGRLRYFIPQLGVLFALGAAALGDYERTVRERPAALAPLRRRLGRWRALADPAAAMKSLLAAVSLLNGVWLLVIFQKYNQGWDVVWGRVPAEEYLRAEHIGVYGHPSQGAFDHLARRLAAGERVGRVMIVGDARSYRCPAPASAASTFNVPRYAFWLEEEPSAEALVRRLRDEGYTHLVLNAPEMSRLTPDAYKTGPFLRLFGQALDKLPPPLYRDRWAILFAVPPA